MDENSNSDIRFRLSKSLRSQPNLRGKRRKKKKHKERRNEGWREGGKDKEKRKPTVKQSYTDGRLP